LKNSSNIGKKSNLWSKSAKKRNVRHVILPICKISAPDFSMSKLHMNIETKNTNSRWRPV
jgi:hypothetical protein